MSRSHEDRGPPHARNGLRVIAVFEAVKGVVVMFAGLGAIALAHQDLPALRNTLVAHLPLDPASRYLHAAIRAVDGPMLWMLATVAGAYAAARFVEAYGLWRQRRWAKWLGALSGAIYLPIEVRELIKGASPLMVVVLVLNLGIVAYLLRSLFTAGRAPN